MARRLVSDKAHEALTGWNAGKPVAALMGEFSSGKSTLLNFMLDCEAAPTRVTATPLPPVWFVHSDTPHTVGLTWEGTEEPVDLADETVDFRARFVAIRKGMPSNVLEACDVIDAPGISDPDLAKDALRFLFRYLDMAIWCTPASQAWRQSEKAIFEKLARDTRARSILVITRIDKLRGKKDQDKVLKRVRSDAGPLFGSVVAIQTPKAAAIPIPERVDGPDSAWVKTGGHAFEQAMTEALAAIGEKPAPAAPKAKAKADTDASVDAVAPALKATEKVAKPAVDADSPEASEAQPASSATPLSARLNKFKLNPANAQHFGEIERLLAAIECDIVSELSDNPLLQECMKIENDDDELEPQRLVSQIGRELRAFRGGGRVRLDT